MIMETSLSVNINFFLPSRSPPAALMAVLATQEDLLENLLGGIPVGDFAVVQASSEEFCLVLGYLLTWKLILIFFKAAPSQVNNCFCLPSLTCMHAHTRLYPVTDPHIHSFLAQTLSATLKFYLHGT